jgi:ABC-2 type transport system permease protein
MKLRLIRYEWRNFTADRAPLVVALFMAVAIAYAAYNGSRWVGFQQQAIASALSEEHGRLNGIRAEIPKVEAGEKTVSAFADPRLPQSLGRNMGLRYAVMPPAPLAALAIGQSDLYPYYFKVSTNNRQSFVSSDEIENPVHLLAGRFDLAFVILYLFPLFILAFSYNLVSGDKESGTLALALSQPVSLHRIVLARVLLRAAFVIALTVLLSIAGVVLGGANLTDESAIARLAFWIAASVAYGAFWFALSIATNALGRSSATNAIALAGLWLLFLVVIPSVLNAAVKAVYPVPSRVELIQSMRVAGEEATRNGSQLLARFMEDHPELAPPQKKGEATHDYGTLLVALNDATERSVQPVMDRFDAQVAGQQRIVDRLRYLSPAIVLQAAFNDLAGAGPSRYRHFLRQTEEYHRRWRDFFTPRILRGQRIVVADIDKLPAFTFQEERTSEVNARLWLELAALWLPVLLVGLLALIALRRYPVS